MSSKKKGCLYAVGVLLALILVVVAGAALYMRVQFNEVVTRLEGEGYTRYGTLGDISKGVVTNVTETLEEPTIIIAREIHIKNGSHRGLALVCESAEISGTVIGNVHFFGRELTLHKDAVLVKNLETKPAMVLKNFGEVQGKITGYQGSVTTTPPPNYDKGL